MALGKYNRRTINETTGAVVAGAEVRFFNQSSGAPVVAYADAAGSTPIGSMVTSGPAGEVEVFLPPGRYRITVSVGGQVVEEITHEPIVGALGVVDPSIVAEWLAVLPAPAEPGVINVAVDGTVSIGPGGGGSGDAAVYGEEEPRTASYTLTPELHNIFPETQGDLTITIPAGLSRPGVEIYMHHVRHLGGGVVTVEGAEGVTVIPPEAGLLTASNAGQTFTISSSIETPDVWHVYGLTDSDGTTGQNGASAYEIAVANGFVGTEVEWLDSLQGADGNDGTVQSIVPGSNITVDNTDPANPVISSTGGGGAAERTLLISYLDELETANRELTELDASGTLTSTGQLYLVDDDGKGVRLTLAQLKTFINTDPTVVPSSVPWRGARVELTADFSVANGTAFSTVSWGTAPVDTDSFWSAGAPTRLTVPSGVTRVRVTTCTRWTSNSTGNRSLSLNLNGGIANGGFGVMGTGSTLVFNGIQAHSSVMEVTAGDYFELRVSQSSGTTLAILPDNRTWFEIEVIEASI